MIARILNFLRLAPQLKGRLRVVIDDSIVRLWKKKQSSGVDYTQVVDELIFTTFDARWDYILLVNYTSLKLQN